MSIRDALIAAGVAPRDIDDALRESRRLVGRTSAAARVLSKVAHQVGTKAAPGSKRQVVALIGSEWLERFSEQTRGLLRPKGDR